MNARETYIPCLETDVPTGLRFDTPRVNQGQIVTVSYGGLGRSENGEGSPFMRIHDASDRTTEFFVLATRWRDLLATRERARIAADLAVQAACRARNAAINAAAAPRRKQAWE